MCMPQHTVLGVIRSLKGLPRVQILEILSRCMAHGRWCKTCQHVTNSGYAHLGTATSGRRLSSSALSACIVLSCAFGRWRSFQDQLAPEILQAPVAGKLLACPKAYVRRQLPLSALVQPMRSSQQIDLNMVQETLARYVQAIPSQAPTEPYWPCLLVAVDMSSIGQSSVLDHSILCFWRGICKNE